MALTTDVDAIARVRRLLDEDKCRLASVEAVVFVGGGTLGQIETVKMTRYWPEIKDEERVVAEDYLRERTSAKNTTATLYVTDPKADKEIRAGRWRRLAVYTSKLRTREADQGVYETLVYWPEEYGDFGSWCAEASPLHHEDVLMSMLAEEPYTAAHDNTPGQVVTARNTLDLLTGAWSGELRTDFAREYPPAGTDVETWSGSNTEETQTRERVNTDEAPYPTVSALRTALGDGGKTIRSSLSINRYARLDTSESITEEKEYPPNGFDAVTHVHGTVLVKETATARTGSSALPSANDQPSEAGIQTDISFSITATGRLNWTHRKQEEARYPAEDTLYSVHGSPLLTETDELVEQMDPAELVADISADAVEGKTIQRGLNINSRGRLGVRKTTRESKRYPEIGTIKSIHGAVLSEETDERAENVRSAEWTQTEDLTGEVVAGKQVSRAFSINPDGTLSVSKSTREAKKWPASDNATWKSGTVYGVETGTRRINDVALPALFSASPSAGHRISAQFSVSVDGAIDWTHIDREDVASAEVVSHYGSLLATETATEKVNDTAAPDPGAGAVGVRNDVGFSITDTGRINWTKRVRTAVESAEKKAFSGSKYYEDESTRRVNSSDVPTGFATHTKTQGVVVSRSFSIDATDGTINWGEDKRTFEASAEVSAVSGSAHETETVARAINQTALPEASTLAYAVGHIRGISFSLDQNGLIDYTRQDRAGTEWSTTWTGGDHRTTRVEVRAGNQTALPSNFTPGSGNRGTIITLSWEFTAFGLFNYVQVTLTAVPGMQSVLREEYLSNTYTLRFWNQSAIPAKTAITGATLTDYDIESVSFTFTDFGTFDGELRVEVPNMNLSTDEIEEEDNSARWQSVQYYFNTEEEQEAKEEEATNGTKVTRVEPRVNRFGLLDQVVTRTIYMSPLGIPIDNSHIWYEVGESRAEHMASGDSFVWVVSTIHYHHKQMVFRTAAEAVSHIAGGSKGSSWGSAGPGMYLADRVQKTYSSSSPF